MSFEVALAMASFALALVSLVMQVFDGDAKKIVIAVLGILVLTTGERLYRSWQRQKEVAFVSDQVLAKLGTQDQTFDEIFDAQHFESVDVVNEALDHLRYERKADDKIIHCSDQVNRLRFYRVRVYFQTNP
jgi:hypothetical protein